MEEERKVNRLLRDDPENEKLNERLHKVGPSLHSSLTTTSSIYLQTAAAACLLIGVCNACFRCLFCFCQLYLRR